MKQSKTESFDAAKDTYCMQDVSEQMFTHALERSTQAGTNDDTVSLARTPKTTSLHAIMTACRAQESQVNNTKDAWPSMVFSP